MTAAYHDFNCDQGADFDVMLRLKSGGSPFDLTGYTAIMQVRSSVAAPAVMIELSTENGRITIDAEAGTLTLKMDAEATAAIKVPNDRSGFPLLARYVYDLLITSPSGGTRFPLRGHFNITAMVTR